MKNLKPNTAALVLLILGLFLYGCTNRQKLKERGVKTTAIVADGKSESRNNYTTYEITLKYELENGEKKWAKVSIGREEYNRLHVSSKVPIAYLPDDPEIVDAIISDEDILFYYGIPNRALRLDDLVKVYNESNLDSITNHLNRISFKWVYTEKDISNWKNMNKNEAISVISDVLVYVTHSGRGFKRKLLSDLEDNGFIKTMMDSTGAQFFENEQYKILVSKKLDKDGLEKRAYSPYFVVSMVKIKNE